MPVLSAILPNFTNRYQKLNWVFDVMSIHMWQYMELFLFIFKWQNSDGIGRGFLPRCGKYFKWQCFRITIISFAYSFGITNWINKIYNNLHTICNYRLTVAASGRERTEKKYSGFASKRLILTVCDLIVIWMRCSSFKWIATLFSRLQIQKYTPCS